MRIELTEEQKKNRKTFCDFRDMHISPYAAKYDKEERLDNEILSKLADYKYLGAMIRKEYGGLEYDQITVGLLNEVSGSSCSSVRSLFTVHGMAANAIQRWGTKEQKAKYLPDMANGKCIGAFALTEPEAGSDAKSIKTQGIETNKYIKITGKKKWITMGQIADIFLVMIKIGEKITSIIVEKETKGLEVIPLNGLMGVKASMLAEIVFNGCLVPKENIIGSIGTGLSHVGLSCLDYGRYTIAWGCVGLAETCLNKSIQHAETREQFNKPLKKHQLIMKMMTEMSVDIKAAKLLCYSAGYLREKQDPESILETWQAKYYASKVAKKVADYAVQIHGAVGCIEGNEIERYYRDAKINEIIEGTSQIHEILIAGNINNYFS